MVTARRVVVVLVLVLAFYVVLIGERGIELVRDGRPAFVLLGVGVLLLPLVGVFLVVQELRFGRATERLGRRLADEGGLPSYQLERRPSGRVDRSAADEVFDRFRREAEAAPDDWRSWYRLALAYGDAGDTARGRGAARHAVALEREERARAGA